MQCLESFKGLGFWKRSKLLCKCISACVAGLTRGNPQKEFFSEMSTTAGQHVVLPCPYNTEYSYRTLNFFWYHQLLGSSFEHALEAFGSSGDNKFCDHRFSVMVYENKMSSSSLSAGVEHN
uniref:Immunoglobulin V-set domain-containing protein n=1 Tax=Gallus gallus TaxID=9031 RepID=A0A8V1A3S6_CHICK